MDFLKQIASSGFGAKLAKLAKHKKSTMTKWNPGYLNMDNSSAHSRYHEQSQSQQSCHVSPEPTIHHPAQEVLVRPGIDRAFFCANYVNNIMYMEKNNHDIIKNKKSQNLVHTFFPSSHTELPKLCICAYILFVEALWSSNHNRSRWKWRASNLQTIIISHQSLSIILLLLLQPSQPSEAILGAGSSEASTSTIGLVTSTLRIC